jgi:Domain of unknown function (DUF4145)
VAISSTCGYALAAMTFPTKCGHCGKDGTLEGVQQVVLNSESDEVQMGMDPDSTMSVEFQTVVDVRRCRECSLPTFTQYDWVDPLDDHENDARNVRLLFPPDRHLEDLPARVRSRYAAMLGLLDEPDVFATRAGKLLEAICGDQGFPETNAQGKRQDLYDRLEGLTSSGNVPAAVKDQAQLVRRYRNVGSHDNDLELGREDVPLIRDFVETFLEFLYWGPAKLQRETVALTTRLTVLRSNRASGSP